MAGIRLSNVRSVILSCGRGTARNALAELSNVVVKLTVDGAGRQIVGDPHRFATALAPMPSTVQRFAVRSWFPSV